jgi:hypothetical protein
MMTKTSSEAVLGILAKKAIARHATEIYNTLPGKDAVTDQNVAGIREKMQRSIDLAELFHDILSQRGYDPDSRYE